MLRQINCLLLKKATHQLGCGYKTAIAIIPSSQKEINDSKCAKMHQNLFVKCVEINRFGLLCFESQKGASVVNTQMCFNWKRIAASVFHQK